MSIDWNHFTPLVSLGGGLMLGLAAALFVLGPGRVAGISGIVGGLLRPVPGNIAWRLAFVAGLIAAPALYRLFAPLPDIHFVTGTLGLVVAGLLVGVGTRYGSGCTSGHGVCGIARRSPRSIIATLVFMSAGFTTVFVIRHLGA